MKTRSTRADGPPAEPSETPAPAIEAAKTAAKTAKTATPSKRGPLSVVDDSTPKRARTGMTPTSVLRQAKTAFRLGSTPQRLVGREAERSAIAGFVGHNVRNQHPASLYISGCPGTGKTALYTEVVASLGQQLASVPLFSPSCPSRCTLSPSTASTLPTPDSFSGDWRCCLAVAVCQTPSLRWHASWSRNPRCEAQCSC